MPYLCTQIDRESRKQQRDTEMPGRFTQGRSVEKEGVERNAHKRCEEGEVAPLGALVRRHRGGIRVNQETLSQLRAGPTLSSAHPGKSFSSDSAHNQREPFLPCDGR